MFISPPETMQATSSTSSSIPVSTSVSDNQLKGEDYSLWMLTITQSLSH